jgi:hypothetical protein
MPQKELEMKTLCKISTKPPGELDEAIRTLLLKPKYYCKKCLRAAAKKQALCKPEKL